MKEPFEGFEEMAKRLSKLAELRRKIVAGESDWEEYYMEVMGESDETAVNLDNNTVEDNPAAGSVFLDYTKLNKGKL